MGFFSDLKNFFFGAPQKQAPPAAVAARPAADRQADAGQVNPSAAASSAAAQSAPRPSAAAHAPPAATNSQLVLYYACSSPSLRVMEDERAPSVMSFLKRATKAAAHAPYTGQPLGPSDGVLLLFMTAASPMRLPDSEVEDFMRAYEQVRCPKFLFICQENTHARDKADQLSSGASVAAWRASGLLSAQYCLDYHLERGIVPPQIKEGPAQCTQRTRAALQHAAAEIQRLGQQQQQQR